MGQLETPGREKGARTDEEGIGPLAPNCRERRIDLAAVAGVHDLDLQSHGAAAVSTSFNVISAKKMAVLLSTASRTAPGTRARRSSSRFADSSASKKLIPVRLPPGRARLATRPSLTGSWLAMKRWGLSWLPPWPGMLHLVRSWR